MMKRLTSANTSAKICLCAPLAALAVCPLEAVELKVFGTNVPAVDLHGFASQGFIWNTGHNDYLGGDSSGGSFDFREYGLNMSIAKGKWRVGAQFFGQKLGPYGDDKVALDWGMVDYQAAQWFGVRGGRVKMPRGLYNEALDLDSTRPFVLLPQSVYDARLRDFQASVDGGMVYGNIDLKGAGSLDYKAFCGAKSMSTSSGASDYFNIDAPYPNLELGMDWAAGGSLFWNTPVQGLRVGYSFTRFENFMTHRYNPNRGTDVYKTAPAYDRHLLSAEYTRGNWVFAAEAGFDDTHYNLTFPPGYAGYPTTYYGRLSPENYYCYLSAAWRVKRWLELGTYYGYSHWEQNSDAAPNITIPTFPVLNQGDFALCAHFILTEYASFKIEGHYLDGSGAVFNVPSHPQPPASRDDSWFLFAAKVGLSF